MESAPSEKELLFLQAVQGLEGITDGLGTEIEPGVREIIAALNLLGIPTNSSCEGHNEEDRISPPYIQGEALGEPQYRYEGEGAIVSSLLEKYKLSRVNDIFGDDAAEKEYYKLIDDLEETDEYREWYKKNSPLRVEVGELIGQFNQE